MRVAFRTDAALEIGTGHVMRCLTLADALRERGATCTFVCRPRRGDMLQAIRDRGHATLALASPVPAGAAAASSPRAAYEAWLGAGWEADAHETVAALAGGAADALVVDHYAIDRRWEERVRGSVRRIAVIDDLADRPHDADLLIDQNTGRAAADYAALVPAHCTVLAGPRFALLRPQFAARRAASLERRARQTGVRKLLVAMGGVDQDNVTGRILDVLAACTFAQPLSISVLLGAQAPCLPQVRARARTMPCPTEVLAGVSDVAALMAECDLSIGAGGGTALERCCLGLPTLLVVIAENQRPGAEALQRAGAVLLVDGGAGLASELPARLAEACRPEVLQALAQASAALTDGTGARAIAQEVLDARR